MHDGLDVVSHSEVGHGPLLHTAAEVGALGLAIQGAPEAKYEQITKLCHLEDT